MQAHLKGVGSVDRCNCSPLLDVNTLSYLCACHWLKKCLLNFVCLHFPPPFQTDNFTHASGVKDLIHYIGTQGDMPKSYVNEGPMVTAKQGLVCKIHRVRLEKAAPNTPFTNSVMQIISALFGRKIKTGTRIIRTLSMLQLSAYPHRDQTSDLWTQFQNNADNFQGAVRGHPSPPRTLIRLFKFFFCNGRS